MTTQPEALGASMSKHTPGPWTWHMEKIGRGVVAKGKTVHASLSAPRANCPPPYSTGVLTANWCTDSDGQVWQAWISVSEANARLIAAAPELLEALRTALDHIDMDALEISHCKDAAAIRAAIAKAEAA